MTTAELSRRGLLGLLAAIPIFGRCKEEGPPSFELVPKPIAGQQVRFSQRRRRTRGGVVEADLVMPLTLGVIEADDSGAVVSWRAGAATLRDASPERRAGLEIAAAATPDVPLVIELDSRGCIRSLVNAGEVRDAYATVIDRMQSTVPADVEQRVIVEQLLGGLKRVFDDPHAIMLMSLREPQVLFSACGRRYGAGEPVQFDTQLQSPIAGPPIRAIARFSIRKVDRRRGEAELGWLMVSNDAETAVGANASVRRLIAPLGASDESVEIPAVELEERADYRVDLRTAWPTWVKHARRIVAGDVESVDLMTFERIAATSDR